MKTHQSAMMVNMFNIDCQLDKIWSHLGNIILAMTVDCFLEWVSWGRKNHSRCWCPLYMFWGFRMKMMGKLSTDSHFPLILVKWKPVLYALAVMPFSPWTLCLLKLRRNVILPTLLLFHRYLITVMCTHICTHACIYTCTGTYVCMYVCICKYVCMYLISQVGVVSATNLTMSFIGLWSCFH